MSVLGWVLAAFFAGLSLFLAVRKRPDSGSTPSARPVTPVRGSEPGPREATSEDARLDRGLREISRYLDRAVAGPLEAALRTDDPRAGAEDAVDALRDLIAYGAATPERGSDSVDLASVVREVAREYTLATGTPVKVGAPEAPERVVVAAERFKDALFLLLSNADRFGGTGVEVRVEPNGGRVEARVRDRGPGFSGEALNRAFEPFWTTEVDALGLGLTHARRLLEAQGGELTLRNAPEGGGEVVVSLRRSGAP